jgi:fumarate reductase iron-sulfur subunit
MSKITDRTVKVKIARFDPSVDKAPHYETYEVPFTQRMTVMDALDYIYENTDPSIAYQGHTSCHRRACARCTATINGKAALTCHTEVEGDLVLEPLPRFRVIRDLVVEGQ